ncbi:tenascin isoform X1 [Astyanax mexicanus]|uniref:tenascin isoform X1 n=1 Tax=Astyanax mexicanus TaxID=7994 RepID=UPI0020CADCD8|nr:tenascin isoform X1 [Astyanax mexicanus]
MPVLSFLHLVLVLLPCPVFLSGDTALVSVSQRVSRDTKPQSIRVVVSEPCLQGGDPCEPSEAKGKEVDLEPGAPLVLTHRIRLVPSSGSGCGGCEGDFAALRARLERLEREVSELREKCGGPEGGCCTSQQSKGAGCTTVQPPTDECPDDCSDQGRCVDGKCVCFPGFSGPDCSESDCPGNCNDKGKCVDGQCVCDPGFTGPDCSQSSCPGNCNNRGRCVNGKCVCNPGFSGPDCSGKSCPKNCSNRGRCVNGKCVCDTGFTGPDCSARSCPRNCSNRGRCVNGKCVCEAGFSGPDCSERSCPGNCNNKGRCVNGQCVCDAGFSGPDCSAKTCPDNCNNRGRCVNGKCVCDEGYGGPDCSERTCPGNCNNKGRCVNGQCVCDPGFTGPDCSERTCPGNCNNKGRCVNGQCVCDPGFAGPDCSAKSCPNDCSDRGQCVDGECVCDEGFTGPECSAKSCPNDCSNKGRCVDGKCVCDVGFTGPDCSTKTCPNNCSNRGRCVRGRCVCRRGFTGPDCSECEEGLTGPDCATALTGVSRLSTRDITESSVTLFWTPPSVQYDTYYITFTSKKESDQKIETKVSGRLTTYTQVGLAAGQQYMVTIIGEKDGKMGTESTTEFQTLISGPKNLQVVKTSTTSVIVQWEQALGEIDRYILFVSPNQTDGSGRGRQEIKLPAERDSAQIEGLEPGRLYDISLVAEKDGALSLPSTTQATPGATTKELPRMETVTMEPSLRHDDSDSKKVETKLNRTSGPFLKNQKLRKPHGASDPGRSRNISMSRPTGQGTPNRPGQIRPGNQPDVIRQPNGGMTRFNGSKLNERGGRIGPYPLRRDPLGRYSIEGPRIKKPIINQESGQEHTITKYSTTTLVMKTSREELMDRVVGSPAVKHDSKGSLSQRENHPTASVLEKPADLKTVPDSSQVSPATTEEPQEPTITTEKNLTAHINGTKCVRRVLVGHRKIHFNGSSGEKTVTKNLTVIVGHVNGNDLIQKLLLGNSEGLVEDVTPSSIEQAKLLQEEGIETGTIVDKQRMSVTSLPTSYTPIESISEKFRSMSSQSGETEETEVEKTDFPLISPYSSPPPLPFAQAITMSQTILLPPKIQKGKHPTRDSSKMPPPQRRYPTRPISSGSSTSGIKKAPITSVTFKDRPPTTNDHVVPSPSPDPFRLNNDDSESKEATVPVQIDSDPPELTKLPEVEYRPITDSEKTIERGEGGMPKNESTKPRNGNLPPYRRTPFRGTFPRRPNTSFQNRTRPILRPPQFPNRSPPLRPVQEPRVPDPDNIPVTQTTGSNQAEPEINGQSSQNGLNPKQTFIFRRRNGSVIRPPPNLHKQPSQKSNSTNIHSSKLQTRGKDSNVSRFSLEKDASSKAPTVGLPTDFTLTTDKPSVPTNDRFQDVAGESEDGTDRILSKVKSRDNITVWQTVPHDQVKPEIISNGSQGSSNRNLRPALTVRGKNGTFVRLPPKHTQIKPIKPKATYVHGVRQGGKGMKDSISDLLIDKNARKDPEPAIVTGKGPRQDPEPGLVTEELTKQGQKTGLETDEDARQDPKLGLVTGKGPRQDPKLGLVTGKVPGQDPKLGLVTDEDARKDPKLVILTEEHRRQDPKTGLATDKGARKQPKLPLITVKVTNQDSRLSTNKTVSKSKGMFEFSESEDGIDHVGVQNVTSRGFLVIWASPRGMFQNFVISLGERGKSGSEEEEEDKKEESPNVLGSSVDSHIVSLNRSDIGVIKKFTKVLPGSARSYPVSDLTPQTGYSVSLFGKGPGLRSNIHSFIISTGPEPPSNLVFSEVTDSSLKVSWTRPKSPVSGFKVTYTHVEDGEPISVAVDGSDSTLPLSKLSPGSSYEVSVISLLGLDESDPIDGVVLTLPDPPTDLRAINVTDTKALLLWRPALATVDQYVIVYGSEEVSGSEQTVKVSGNAAEQQLQSLRANTKYTVTIISQLGEHKSPAAITIFTTTSGSGGRGEGPRDLTASQVTPRTAVLSWKPPASAVTGYKLTYFTESQEMKEVIIEPGITEYKLTGLHPSSTYTARLQGQRGGVYTTAISTQFTTGTLRFPFPSDCSQELMNGVRESGVVEIFPRGKEGKPVRVYCDMETDGGGWTVFQRRKDGKTNFFRGWQEYSKGFGELEGEFWLGNELLHNLTMMTPMSMRVDLRSGSESVYAAYSTFSVDTMKRHYTLRVSGYSGTAGDSMTYHDRRKFSTRDRDPQPFITRCAMSYKGGWWYKNCHEANLNGLYNTHTDHQGVIWTAWKGKDFSIPFAEMKLRPSSFNPRTQG